MSLETASATMQAVCAVRAEYAAELGDALARRVLEVLPAGAEVRARLDTGSRGMFSRSIRLRSLYIARAMRDAAADHAQLVVLSAGLDFRAMSDVESWGQRARVFLDHPASQALAHDVLRAIDFEPAPPAKLVALDLATFGGGDLARALVAAGVDPELPILIVWEGATYYIEPEVVTRTLKEVLEFFSRVHIVADFLQRNAYFRPDGEPLDEGAARNLEYVRSLGEPWVGFFDAGDLVSVLRDHDCTRVDVTMREDAERDLLGEVLMSRGTMFFIDAWKGWTHGQS